MKFLHSFVECFWYLCISVYNKSMRSTKVLLRFYELIGQFGELSVFLLLKECYCYHIAICSYLLIVQMEVYY